MCENIQCWRVSATFWKVRAWFELNIFGSACLNRVSYRISYVKLYVPMGGIRRSIVPYLSFRCVVYMYFTYIHISLLPDDQQQHPSLAYFFQYLFLLTPVCRSISLWLCVHSFVSRPPLFSAIPLYRFTHWLSAVPLWSLPLFLC